MAIVTPSDHPKSVRNRCVIDDFGGVFVLSRCILDFSVGVGAFVIGLSQISSFFSLNRQFKNIWYCLPYENNNLISILVQRCFFPEKDNN